MTESLTYRFGRESSMPMIAWRTFWWSVTNHGRATLHNYASMESYFHSSSCQYKRSGPVTILHVLCVVVQSHSTMIRDWSSKGPSRDHRDGWFARRRKSRPNLYVKDSSCLRVGRDVWTRELLDWHIVVLTGRFQWAINFLMLDSDSRPLDKWYRNTSITE